MEKEKVLRVPERVRGGDARHQKKKFEPSPEKLKLSQNLAPLGKGDLPRLGLSHAPFLSSRKKQKREKRTVHTARRKKRQVDLNNNKKKKEDVNIDDA